MAFRFPLATVLLVREHAEEREERALKKIQLEISRVRREIEQLVHGSNVHTLLCPTTC